MTIKKLFYTTLGVAGLAALSSLYVWFQLPADAAIAVHWNIEGVPDSYAQKTWGLFVTPLMILALSPLIRFLPALEPRREHLKASMKLLATTWVGALVVVLIAHMIILLSALGVAVDVMTAIATALGVMFVLIGNVLGKSKSTFFVGFRTPWTLSSDNVWNKTHRLVGKLFMAAGVVIVILPHTGIGSALLSISMMSAILVPVLIGIVYSFVVWKKEQTEKG